MFYFRNNFKNLSIPLILPSYLFSRLKFPKHLNVLKKIPIIDSIIVKIVKI